MAADMMRLQAERESKPGVACPPDSHWQQEFEAAFPYTETDDQLRAIDDCKDDLMRARPMDRLICGDVGYGKTEVAMRAAFKAVDAGRQVAVLVPTTVLAEQHYRTFQRPDGGVPGHDRRRCRGSGPRPNSATSSQGLESGASTSSSARIGSFRPTSSSRTWACWSSTKSSGSASRPRRC